MDVAAGLQAAHGADPAAAADPFFSRDFTETGYRELLELAREHYTFRRFTEYRLSGRNILWRHDVDFSVHRAHALARLDAEAGIVATYFINPHSDFYNALEFDVAELIRDIGKMGHDIGLHFDGAFHQRRLEGLGLDALEEILEFERRLLEQMFDVSVTTFSLHNPDLLTYSLPQESIAGMINVYADAIRERYGYCSDSNGYWRFRRLKAVLADASDDCLQVLTHPEWWTPEVLTPRERVTRCIEGRAARQHSRYDELLARAGRANVL